MEIQNCIYYGKQSATLEQLLDIRELGYCLADSTYGIELTLAVSKYPLGIRDKKRFNLCKQAIEKLVLYSDKYYATAVFFDEIPLPFVNAILHPMFACRLDVFGSHKENGKHLEFIYLGQFR